MSPLTLTLSSSVKFGPGDTVLSYNLGHFLLGLFPLLVIVDDFLEHLLPLLAHLLHRLLAGSRLSPFITLTWLARSSFPGRESERFNVRHPASPPASLPTMCQLSAVDLTTLRYPEKKYPQHKRLVRKRAAASCSDAAPDPLIGTAGHHRPSDGKKKRKKERKKRKKKTTQTEMLHDMPRSTLW
ncbi:hypothetical protein EYF80_024825 [Liparis tanakae]|uniref:Uncharacterized protein n=1 Tax=Liparis tanakae TaxID=230148 RepID=A0A4Z2HH62_9TELE|nr:hypothetical protein EYF80_024825 [Liparis tanakae]